MAKNLNYFKVGILLTRIVMALIMIYWGVVTLDEAGERTYNKYLHALRKMYVPSGKPSDIFAAGITFDNANKALV